jgi:LPS sulfotransferase NodH
VLRVAFAEDQLLANPIKSLFTQFDSIEPNITWPNASADDGYIIYFTGRCGSTELVEILSSTGICGSPGEFFNEAFIGATEDRGADIGEYISRLVQTTSAGRKFGFKIDGFRHRWTQAIIDLRLWFPKEHFVQFFMTRRNILEQAYSYAHAKASGAWHKTSDQTQLLGRSEASVGLESLLREIALVLDQETYFENYFLENGIDPIRFDYESFCASRAFVIGDLMQRIGIPRDAVLSSVAASKGRYHKLQYDERKEGLLLDFQQQHRELLSILNNNRGRITHESARILIRRHTGIDILSPEQAQPVSST